MDKSWLFDPNSMTAKMKSACAEQFYLKLISQEKKELTKSEKCLLNINSNEKMLVREVEMGCANDPWLFGRSIFTEALVQGEKGDQLLNLGTSPLGELLALDPNLKRSPFEILEITPSLEEYQWVAVYQKNQSSVIARRSIFYFFQNPLLLTEFFLTL